MKPSVHALIVFVKPPESGKVKTRLGKTIGFEKAASVYEQLLIYTANICAKLEQTTVYIFHSGKTAPLAIWQEFENELQTDGDLGKKMAHAFQFCFQKGHQKVIGIGSDCISIQHTDIEAAFNKLTNKDIVFGPAQDGGYYLIGMRQYFSFLFQNMPWSQPQLLEKTLDQCHTNEKSVALLQELSDIDYEEDLYAHKKELQTFNPTFFSFLNQNEKLSVSVIIPALNEEKTISACIKALTTNDYRLREIVVVDVKSEDNTAEIASNSMAKVIISDERSRSKQMNLGAEHAKGNYLYFVHADTKVPQSYLNDIEKKIDSGYESGCYRFKFDSKHPILKINSFMTRFPFLICRGGDQSLFIKKERFEQLGDFKEELSIMEEYDLLLRLKKNKIKFGIMPKSVVVSARKYEKNGYWKVQHANFSAFRMFKKGRSQEEIKKVYNERINIQRYE